MARIGLDGVYQIYPSQDQGEVWYQSIYNPNGDGRFNPDGLVQGTMTEGFYISDNHSPNITVETSTGFTMRSLPQKLNHKEAASKGYMWNVNDWEQVEITGYFQVNVADDDFVLSITARGADQDQPMPWCPGSAYRLEIKMSGKFRFVKQQYYLSAVPWSQGWVNVEDLTDPLTAHGPFGIKFCCYNVDIGNGKQGVKLQFYLDPGLTNAFVKLGEIIDNGGWGNADEVCFGAKDQILTWGGPLIRYTWNNASDLRFRLLSVRTINPGGAFPEPVPPVGKVLVSSTHVYRIGISAKQTCESVIPQDPNPPPPPPGGGQTTTVKKFAEQHSLNKW